jgi:hypothetical protein
MRSKLRSVEQASGESGGTGEESAVKQMGLRGGQTSRLVFGPAVPVERGIDEAPDLVLAG